MTQSFINHMYHTYKWNWTPTQTRRSFPTIYLRGVLFECSQQFSDESYSPFYVHFKYRPAHSPPWLPLLVSGTAFAWWSCGRQRRCWRTSLRRGCRGHYHCLLWRQTQPYQYRQTTEHRAGLTLINTPQFQDVFPVRSSILYLRCYPARGLPGSCCCSIHCLRWIRPCHPC